MQCQGPGASGTSLPRSTGELAGQVQRHGAGGDHGADPTAVHDAAAHGISGSGAALPHLAAIQASFGRHDVNQVQAHTGAEASEGSRAMGAEAFATGNHIAFAGAPTLHTAAHEAAHVIEGVTGFLLEQRTAAAAPGADHVRRVTVTEVSLVAPAPGLFARPDGFRWFDGIDAARAEDRRLGELAAAQAAPSAEDRKRYVGRWELEGAPGAQILEVSESGAGYALKTIEPGAIREEAASLLGRQLRVDESPNYRLYQLDPEGHLVLVGDENNFRYHRAASSVR